MVAINWEHLAKNQTDPETIEEAIVRIVQEHDDDPEAHLESGQSLEAHKNSDVIDHLAFSIVNDKVKERNIDPSKFNYPGVCLEPSLESVDAWYKSLAGTGAFFEPFVSCIELRCGYQNNSKTLANITLGNYMAVGYPDGLVFECKAVMTTDVVADFRIGAVQCDPSWNGTDNFGFEKLHTDSHVFCFYIHNGSKTRFDLGAFDPTGWIRYRAECILTTPNDIFTLNFYIDGVLKKTYTGVTLNIDSDQGFGIGMIKKASDYDNPSIVVSNILWYVIPLEN